MNTIGEGYKLKVRGRFTKKTKMRRRTITKKEAEKILKYSNCLGKQCGQTKGKDSEKRMGKDKGDRQRRKVRMEGGEHKYEVS